MTPGDGGGGAVLRAPALWRRMAALAYEALLLFGLGLIPGLLGALLFAQTGKTGPMPTDLVLQGFALVFYAIYFVWFWSARGQTLAMRTWRIRVVRSDGAGVGQGRALLRYLCCCVVWLAAPALAASLAQLRPWPTLGLLAAWIALYALSAGAAPGRQYWHDLICGTRLLDTRSEPSPNSPTPRPR